MKSCGSDIVLSFNGIAYAKMMALVSSFSTEVAWYGVIEKRNANLYHVQDILVHPQYVSGGRVQDADEEYSEWICDIWKQGDLFERMRLHGHSHVSFAAIPSSLDWTNYRDRMEQMDGEGLKIFLIWNKRNEFWCAVMDYEESDQLRFCNQFCVDSVYIHNFVEEAKSKSSELTYKSSGTDQLVGQFTECIDKPVYGKYVYEQRQNWPRWRRDEYEPDEELDEELDEEMLYPDDVYDLTDEEIDRLLGDVCGMLHDEERS